MTLLNMPSMPRHAHIEHPLSPPHVHHPHSRLGDDGYAIASTEHIEIDRPWVTCGCSQHVRRLKARLDQMDYFLQ